MTSDSYVAFISNVILIIMLITLFYTLLSQEFLSLFLSLIGSYGNLEWVLYSQLNSKTKQQYLYF